MSKRNPFLPIDLQILSNSEEEQERTRKVFEYLKLLASNNEFMTEQEKTFFCMCVKNSLLNDGNVSNYLCCENYLFKELYLTYWADLTGTGRYTKLYGCDIKEVPLSEKQADLEKLISTAKDWEELVIKENHSEKLLQAMSKEARESIKLLNKEPEFNPQNNPFFKGSFLYKYKKWNLILYAKYIYLMAKEVFEYSTKEEFHFNLCGQSIEMDELSIIHILQRHFGEGVKKFQSGKSHFYGEFKPKELNNQFRDILARIEQSQTLTAGDIFKLPFLYKQHPYMIWISKKTKQEKGQKGNIKFLHLSSFHPIKDKDLLIDLENNYELILIDNELSIYRLKTQ